jgi:hypothetical protein
MRLAVTMHRRDLEQKSPFSRLRSSGAPPRTALRVIGNHQSAGTLHERQGFGQHDIRSEDR